MDGFIGGDPLQAADYSVGEAVAFLDDGVQVREGFECRQRRDGSWVWDGLSQFGLESRVNCRVGEDVVRGGLEKEGRRLLARGDHGLPFVDEARDGFLSCWEVAVQEVVEDGSVRWGGGGGGFLFSRDGWVFGGAVFHAADLSR